MKKQRQQRTKALTLEQLIGVKDENDYLLIDGAQRAAGIYVKSHPEIFVESDDYPGYYATVDGDVYHLSTYGKVYKIKTSCLTVNNEYGYLIFNAYKNKKCHTVTLHKFLTECFFGKVPEGYEIDHKDRNHFNNHLMNLHYIPIPKNRAWRSK